jgi:hypothetical protein
LFQSVQVAHTYNPSYFPSQEAHGSKPDWGNDACKGASLKKRRGEMDGDSYDIKGCRIGANSSELPDNSPDLAI